MLRLAFLMAATMTTGLMAGVFGIYANAIMPGLRRVGDRTFVDAFQAVDRAIENPLFLVVGFLGTLVFTGVAAVLHLGSPVLPWTVAALLLYLVVFVVTLAVNVPLNNGIKAAGPVDSIVDLIAVRERFNEARWVRWNLLRTVLCVVAFGCLCWALVLHGRIG